MRHLKISIPGSNAEAIEVIKNAASGHGEKFFFVSRGTRSGLKSFIAGGLSPAARHKNFRSLYLPLSSLLSEPPEMLHGLETLQLVCIDDLQSLASSPQWEEAVFHLLFNRVHDAGGTLIMAANDLPNALPLTLPDLKSRLSYGVVYQLHPLTDAEKINVLIARAKGRGITLSEEVGKYLLSHCPRHMSTLLAALDALDKASLARAAPLDHPVCKGSIRNFIGSL